MYDPTHLRTFLAVAQTLSFTQAAHRLGLRQSTVSQHVRRLEDATGRTLFARDTHSVDLTEDGEAMLGFARTILAAHERAAAFFTGTRLRGKLRFGASEDFVLTRLPEILSSFRHDHPEVDLELTVELSGILHEQLAADTHPVASLGLCELRLLDDANYPWLVLVPRVAEARELTDLTQTQQATLMREIDRVARTLQQVFRPFKLNIAALGNVVPQLHVHIIARFRSDPAWPRPVWGAAPSREYTAEEYQRLVGPLRRQIWLT